jgi:hypothetical protein
VVVLSDIDNPGWQEPGRLMGYLERHLGRIYRKIIAEGLAIRLSTDRDPKGVSVIVRDPMCQIPGSAEVELFGAMDTRASVAIHLDGRDVKSLPEVIDPATGEPAVIRIRMVKVDVAKVREALNITDNVVASGTEKRRLGSWGFNYKGQGFSVVRNGREIQHGESLGCFTKDGKLNYFRGEVSFPSCLDDLFKVQVIKSRYALDIRLKDVIANRCQSTIAQIRRETAKERAQLAVRRHPSTTPSAEQQSAGLREVVERRKIPKKELKAKQEALAERKEEVIAKVDSEADSDIAQAKEDAEHAKKTQGEALAKLAEERAAAITKRAKQRKVDVRNRFKVDAFCRKFVKPLRGGDLYAVEDYHDEIWVTINSESDFFKSMYERASQFAEQEALLDLVIFAIAYAEADKANSDEMKRFWADARKSISRLSHIFVSMIGYEEPPEEVVAAGDEVDVDPAQIGGQPITTEAEA